MPVFGARSLRALCSTGVPVTFRGVSTYPDGVAVKGNLDVSGSDASFETTKVSDVTNRLELPFNAFNPFPKSRDPITVDGDEYRVVDVTPLEDGAMVELLLRSS